MVSAVVKRYETELVWFRRDLRNYDHAALYHALKDARQVHCVFVFETEILDLLADRQDRRVEFIWLIVEELALSLKRMGGGLQVLAGRARDVIPALADRLGAQVVYANQDYEPIAKERDAEVSQSLERRGCVLHTYKDHVIFEKDEVLTQAGRSRFLRLTRGPGWRNWIRSPAMPIPSMPIATLLRGPGRSGFLRSNRSASGRPTSSR